MSAFDVATIKREFPILAREINGKRLVYLDSASSSQKPTAVLDAEGGVHLRWVPLTADYRLDTSNLAELLDGAKLFAFSAMSNVLGTINDVRALADAGHAAGAHVLVDACQYVPHVGTDVQEW